MAHASPEIAIAILAKAPVPGQVMTRLAPSLGADGAAALQARLIARAVDTACAAGIGPVTLWASDETHAVFRDIGARVALARQPGGDLGARMLAAIAAANGPALVIGTDCPALTAGHLRDAARVLRDHDAVAIPADDGGYVLIGLRQPQPLLFSGMAWSTATVMAETRRRLASLGLAWQEPARLWDVDRPEDVERMRREGFAHLIDG